MDKLHNPLWATILAGLWLAVASWASAQTLPPLGDNSTAASQNQPIVDEISIQVQGPQPINRDAVMAHILQPEKAPYSPELVDKSIKSLNDTGQYEFIRTDREAMPDGGVRVIFRIVPYARISAVIFNGNKEYAQARLSGEIKTVAGALAVPDQLKRDVAALTTFYEKKGYAQVKVGEAPEYTMPKVDINETTGTAIVTFNIDEGPDVAIRHITFVGNDHLSASELRDVLGKGDGRPDSDPTTEYTWLISWITGSGRFQKDQFADDLDRLRAYYKSKGFLDVDIPEDKITFTYPTPGNLTITIPVHEGRQYHIGKNITVSGNTVFTSDVLKGLLTIKPGDVFSPDEVDKNAKLISDYYGNAGYLDTFVRVDRHTDESNDIGLDFVVMHPLPPPEGVGVGESEKFYVEGINIQGNTKTKSTVIVRELTLTPGDVFDTERMRVSEERLRNTHYFSQVRATPEDTNIPGKRNLRITVEEAKTFTASVGAGFSGEVGGLAYLEFSEINFDLFSPSTYFRGGGQQARVKLTLGTELSGVEINYLYPWLFERELAVGIDLFHTQASYYSTTFSEEDTGFNVYLTKPLFELVDGTFGYSLKQTSITDLDPSAPPPVLEEQGDTTVSKVYLDLKRTKDIHNPDDPTSGQVQSLSNEFAGGPIGGQTNIYRVSARAKWWFQTFDSYNQVLSFAPQVSSVMGYDGKGVPYSEREFLGGQDDLRGYAYRWVGPKFIDSTSLANGQPLGGKTLAAFTTEYSFELFTKFRFVVFHDIGFVNYNSWDFNPNSYRQDVGFGLHFFLLNAPLHIDFGFPLNPDAFQSHSLQFNFSFSAAY